jgi:hypothetical membrane protein
MRTQEKLAWAGISGPVLFTVTYMAQEAFRRGEYSPVAEPVSALEAGPNGWIQQVNFVVFGLLTLAFAVGLHRGLRPSRGGAAGPVLMAVTGVALILAAVFPLRENAQGETFDPGGHTPAGVAFFGTSMIALIVLSRRMARDPRWAGLSGYALITGLLGLPAFVAMGSLVMPDGAALHSWAGLGQRAVILLLIFPCRIVLAVRMLRLGGEPAPAADPIAATTAP